MMFQFQNLKQDDLIVSFSMVADRQVVMDDVMKVRQCNHGKGHGSATTCQTEATVPTGSNVMEPWSIQSLIYWAE